MRIVPFQHKHTPSNIITVNIITDYGAPADGQQVTRTITINNGSPNLSATTATWTAGDVGKYIAYGTPPTSFISTIDTVTDSTHVILHDNHSGATISGVSNLVEWGHDNGPAFTAFHNAFKFKPEDIVTLIIPAGRYCMNSWEGVIGATMHPCKNIKTVTFQGRSAIFSDMLTKGSFWVLGGSGMNHDSMSFSRVNTVSAGSSTVTILPTMLAGTITFGSGYIEGVYTQISLTGGSGTGAIADVRVASDGTVREVVPRVYGSGYVTGDVLSCPAASIGGTGSGWSVQIAISSASMFTAGTWAVMTGFDLQGTWDGAFGFPPAPQFSEYVQIKSVGASTITFQSPLVNSYKQTWPMYNTGNLGEISQGGFAALSLLDPSWDTAVEFTGLTFEGAQQQESRGRSAIYRNCTIRGPGPIPSENGTWQLYNCDVPDQSIEVDKIVDEIIIDNSRLSAHLQNPTGNTFTIRNNSTVALNGTGHKTTISDSHLTFFGIGSSSYGSSGELTCTNCVIDVLTHVGLLEKFAGDAGINNVAGYSMTAGVITVPNTAGAPRWAAPGYYCAWNGAQTNEGGFQILDVTQDATNTYVTTSLSNTGWPTVPLTSGKLFVQVHPCPKMTFTNCTGCPEAVTFSNAPAGLPLGSYYNFTFNPTNVLVASDAPVWGSPTSVTLNVTSAYSGASNPLTLEAVLPLVTPGSASISFYDAFINLRTAGSRVSTPSGGSSGGQAGDSGLTGLPAVSWCSGDFAYAFAPDVSGSSPTIPVVTVTIVTDQGITWP